MASAPPLQIAGVNLDNYFPTKSPYNTIIYVHKKFLSKQKIRQNHEISEAKKTSDKCQQFDSENLNADAYRVINTFKNNTPVIDQTIRFAKEIIPLTIPPSTDNSSQPLYTIKAVKKSKKKSNNLKSESVKDATYEKEKHNSVYEHFKSDKLKRRRESTSARETVNSSQSNTLDDINENRTLSCTLSEISEKKHHKEDRHCKRNKRNEMQKVAVSESFEAVATEFMNTSTDTKIKIHLMNERDKNLFCQNIQTPVIESIKECITELNNSNLKAMQCMQSAVEEQTKKMDVIFNKLTSFEEKLTMFTKLTKQSTTNVTASTTTKSSKLEELSADIFEVKAISSSEEEELGEIDLLNKNLTNRTVKDIKSKDKKFVEIQTKKMENLGCGEEVPAQLKTQLGVKPDRPNRAPARFCWTDAGRSN